MGPCNQIQIRAIETLIFVRELDVVKTNFLLHSFIKNDLRVIKTFIAAARIKDSSGFSPSTLKLSNLGLT